MYKLEFLPLAKQDMDNIVDYISTVLNNTSAALNLRNLFMAGAKSILTFPYGSAKHTTISLLKNEYRSIKINNYLMFYTISEKDKIITVVRVLYQKMNFENVLKDDE